ncbi:chitin synthesis regulation, resistance to congo red-domain-containing protein [Calycina marina]|uniref:Chitin synthesis regulation, resistance to congo red-domain-containing protein n=1 Tax=Calycina marina TaxID=1763456 RepID=A0A9P7Z7R0_9HELO|nr:chitin synthesis regulation, resistance to congo red-domain-containing protein [Calycina marina]
MAPTLSKRYTYCQDQFGDIYSCNGSAWDSWGRWVALVLIIVVVLFFAFLCSCTNARRRRRNGMAPMYGTGWIPAGNKYQRNGNYGGAAPPYGGAPAPPYTGPSNIPNQNTGTTFNSNDGYYGGHNQSPYAQPQQEYELQPPQNTYHSPRGEDPVYQPPPGAPPAKR